MSQRCTLWPLLMAVSVATIALAWSPGFAAPYQYDDYVTPLKDPASQSLASWLDAIPQTLRPLTKLSYALESSVGAEAAASRRVLNAALFVTSTTLVALLAGAAGLPAAPAAALATLWAVHPVHAETVIALAGRSVLLSLCLMLASALALLRGRHALAIALALLAVLARETAWAWLVACASLWAVRSPGARARLPAALVSALLVGGTLVLSSSRLRTLLAISYGDAGAFDRLGLQWAALPKGMLMLLFEPSAFSVDIDFAPRGALRLGYLALAVLLYGGAVWLALRRASSQALRVAALLWLCLVIPLHSVVPKLDPLTARSVSASSAALCVALAAGGAGFLTRNARRLATYGVGVGVVLALLVPTTRARAALYRAPIALWRDAAARSTRSIRPLLNLGTLLAQKGQLEEARAALEQAARRDPSSSKAREKLAAIAALIETERLLTEPPAHGAGQEHETHKQ